MRDAVQDFLQEYSLHKAGSNQQEGEKTACNTVVLPLVTAIVAAKVVMRLTNCKASNSENNNLYWGNHILVANVSVHASFKHIFSSMVALSVEQVVFFFVPLKEVFIVLQINSKK